MEEHGHQGDVVDPREGGQLDYLLLRLGPDHTGGQGMADEWIDEAGQGAHIVVVGHPFHVVERYAWTEHLLKRLPQRTG